MDSLLANGEKEEETLLQYGDRLRQEIYAAYQRIDKLQATVDLLVQSTTLLLQLQNASSLPKPPPPS